MERLTRLDRDVVPCCVCNGQPRLVEAMLRSQWRTECCPCASRSPPFPTAIAAIEFWNRQNSAPVQVVRRLSVAR
jgi:hypothetical protein